MDEIMITTMTHEHADRRRSYELLAEAFRHLVPPVSRGTRCCNCACRFSNGSVGAWHGMPCPVRHCCPQPRARRGGQFVAPARCPSTALRTSRRYKPSSRANRGGNGEWSPSTFAGHGMPCPYEEKAYDLRPHSAGFRAEFSAPAAGLFSDLFRVIIPLRLLLLSSF